MDRDFVAYNFVAYIEESIRDHWSLPAFSDYKAATLSYGEVGERIYRLHALFDELGLQRGDKVCLLGRNSSGWALAYLAVASYGATVVPILPDFHPADCEGIIGHSDSVLLFTSEAFLEKLDPSKLSRLKAVLSLSSFAPLGGAEKSGLDRAIAAAGARFEREYRPRLSQGAFSLKRIGDEELAAIVYTSGTTGFSKGVMLTHGNFLSNLQYARKMMPLKTGDTILSFLPLAHMFGNAFEFIFPFSVGCHITFLGKMPTTNVLIEAFAAVKPRMILSVPLVIEKIYYKQIKPMLEDPKLKALMKLPLFRRLVDRKVRDKIIGFFGGNVMVVIIGGASFSPEVEDFLLRIKFPFTVGYGMTECAPLICYCDWWKRSKADCGKLVDRMEMRIEGGSESTPGEIWLRGANLMKGYYKNPEETAKVIDADGLVPHRRPRVGGREGRGLHPRQEQDHDPRRLGAEHLPRGDRGQAQQPPPRGGVSRPGRRGQAHRAWSTPTSPRPRSAASRTRPSPISWSRIGWRSTSSSPSTAGSRRSRSMPEEFSKTPTNKIKRYMYQPA